MTYSFAETYKAYPDGQQNVTSLPDSVMATGFVPAQPNSRGQPMPAQWLNWMFQKFWRYFNRDKVSDAAGVGLFTTPNSCIRLEAFDPDTPANVLVAIGYKGAAGVTHQLTTVYSVGLTLGVATVDGDQPVTGGGANTVLSATSRQFGDL